MRKEHRGVPPLPKDGPLGLIQYTGADMHRYGRLAQRYEPDDAALTEAYAEGRKDEADENGAASKLIDAWVAAHGKPVPWAAAVEIVAIVNKLPPEERERLLALAEAA